MGKFLTDMFQDVDGDYSSKRTAFFFFIFLFTVMVAGIYFKVADPPTLNFLQSALDKVTSIIEWLGGFIVAERAPALGGKK